MDGWTIKLSCFAGIAVSCIVQLFLHKFFFFCILLFSQYSIQDLNVTCQFYLNNIFSYIISLFSGWKIITAYVNYHVIWFFHCCWLRIVFHCFCVDKVLNIYFVIFDVTWDLITTYVLCFYPWGWLFFQLFCLLEHCIVIFFASKLLSILLLL